MKKVTIALYMFLLVTILVACQNKGAQETTAYSEASSNSVVTAGTQDLAAGVDTGDTAQAGGTAIQAESSGQKGLTSPEVTTPNDAGAGSGSQTSENRKLIKRLYMDMETKEFDNTLQKVNSMVLQVGGYMESSNISGSSYYQENGNRNAYIVCRIPVSQYDGFVQNITQVGNVINTQENTEDITLQYVDTESHIKALQVEQDRLLTLLNQAEKMEDIIVIESKLTDIRYELQNFETTLKTYDNQIEYSTITVNIMEVERISDADQQGFWQQIASKFKTNVYHIGEGLKNLTIWFFSSIPYLILIGILVLLGFFVYKILKRYDIKKNKIQDSKTTSEKEEK